MQFMAAKKGGKFSQGMSPLQLELYAVCLVQAAWRRKMSYRAAILRRRVMRFLDYLRSKDPKYSKKVAGDSRGLFGGKKKKANERKKVDMVYLGPTSRYPTAACLQQMSMQQVQQFLTAMLYRVAKGALGRFKYKRLAYMAKHGDYLAKVVKVQAYQRGRVVRKQVRRALLTSKHFCRFVCDARLRLMRACAGDRASPQRAPEAACCAHVQAGGVSMLQHVARRVAGVQVRCLN
jgi:hypothetical protein